MENPKKSGHARKLSKCVQTLRESYVHMWRKTERHWKTL